MIGTKTEEDRFRLEIYVQVITSLVTLVVTVAVTAGVVNYQLSREHEFVARQATAAHQERMLEEKIRLHRELVQLSLEHHHRMDKVRLTLVGMLNFADLDGSVQTTESIIMKLLDTVFADLEEMLKSKAELGSILEMAPHYFGHDVEVAIDHYRSEMKKPDSPIASQEQLSINPVSSVDPAIERLVNEVIAQLPSTKIAKMRADIGGLEPGTRKSENSLRAITNAMALEITSGQ